MYCCTTPGTTVRAAQPTTISAPTMTAESFHMGLKKLTQSSTAAANMAKARIESAGSTMLASV